MGIYLWAKGGWAKTEGRTEDGGDGDNDRLSREQASLAPRRRLLAGLELSARTALSAQHID